MHAIAEGVRTVGIQPRLGAPETKDILVDFLGGWQLEEVDGSLVPDFAFQRLDQMDGRLSNSFTVS